MSTAVKELHMDDPECSVLLAAFAHGTPIGRTLGNGPIRFYWVDLQGISSKKPDTLTFTLHSVRER